MKKTLRILQTPAHFSPYVGGVEKYVLELSKELVSQGHIVTVVCPNEPTSKPASKVSGVEVVRLPYISKVANTNITLGLFRTLIRQDFDVIHTHIPTPWSADISALVSLVRRKPLIVTYHNDLTGNAIGKLVADVYNATLLHLVLARANKIIITQPKYLEYSKHLKWHKKKVAVVPLGVTVPMVIKGVQRKKDQLFFMSVLDQHHEYKGLGVLLEAIAEVKRQQPTVKLLVGGKGELVTKYKQKAESLGIGESVEFLGYVPDKKLAECYASSATFVLPSLTHMEGFGIVALEALSYGTPVITTTLAGSSELVARQKAGIVVEPRDTSALAHAILALVGNPRKAVSMGQRGLENVTKDFSWQSIGLQIADIYMSTGVRRAENLDVLQVSAYYPPHLGGQENVVQDLATHLAAQGQNVRVVTSDLGATQGVTIENGVIVTRLHALEAAHTAVIWKLLPWMIKHTKKHTIVHLHVGQVFTPEIVFLASKIRRFKYITHMHIEPVQSGAAGVFLPIYTKLFLRPALRGSAMVIVLNTEHKKIIEDQYGYKGKVVVMSNGIDDMYFNVKRRTARSNSRALKLLFVGRLAPQKNLPTLIKAVASQKTNVTLDIVGDGEQRTELEELVKQMKVKNVTLHGRIARDKVPQIYATSDAFVLPSLYEAQPLVLLEAMAAQIPIIGTSVRGVKEHIVGRGILTEPTTSGLEEGICLFSDMPSGEISSMVASAHKKASTLKWSYMTEKYLELYGELGCKGKLS